MRENIVACQFLLQSTSEESPRREDIPVLLAETPASPIEEKVDKNVHPPCFLTNTNQAVRSPTPLPTTNILRPANEPSLDFDECNASTIGKMTSIPNQSIKIPPHPQSGFFPLQPPIDSIRRDSFPDFHCFLQMIQVGQGNQSMKMIGHHHEAVPDKSFAIFFQKHLSDNPGCLTVSQQTCPISPIQPILNLPRKSFVIFHFLIGRPGFRVVSISKSPFLLSKHPAFVWGSNPPAET